MKRFLIFILALTSYIFAAAPAARIKWTFTAVQVSPDVFDLKFIATLDKGWHVYSQHQDPSPDGFGPFATSFSFAKSNAYTLSGGVKETSKLIKLYDKDAKANLAYFLNKAVFVQRVKLNQKVSAISGKFSYDVCNDEMCLPPKEDVDFTFNLKQAAASPAEEKKQDHPLRGDMDNTGSHSGSQSIITMPGKIYAFNNTDSINPVKWTFALKYLQGKQYELQCKAKMDAGWAIYETGKMEGVDGPGTTDLTLDNKDIKLIGALTAPAPQMVYDSILKQQVKVYKTDALFRQVLEIENPSVITGNITYEACNNAKMICSGKKTKFTVTKDKSSQVTVESAKNKSLFTIFGEGFLGGLVALLTPCVFPMIPLTVSFFTKNDKKKRGLGKAALFGISIVVIYVGLGIIISALFGSNALNNLSSNVYLNLLFFLVFIVFAFSFLGAFDISLPSSWANRADEQSEKGGLLGVFFVAFTLAIVSFSCTGPIIGNLLVIAANNGGYKGPATGMFGFSIALALPFTLFAIFPSLMQQLPKSGGWLNSVKVTLGFLELALALKFLSNVDLAYHWNFLKREYFLALWIIIFALLGFYLLGKLRFSHDSPSSHVSVFSLLMAIICFAFSLYMIPGLWGAPVKILSGLAPPASYTEWDHYTEQTSSNVPSSTGASASDQETQSKKYEALFHCPLGINCHFDYKEAVQLSRKLNKPLMVDFTGHSCVNCRKMEENVWSDQSVLSKIKNDYILVSLYTDDRTSLDSADMITTDKGEKITTLGAKWAYLEESKYERNSQPYYVLLDGDEHVLVPPKAYDPDINDYANFLNAGKKEFETRHNK